MEHIDRFGKLDCIDSSIRIAVIVFDNLDHAGATETLYRFRVGMFAPALRNFESESQVRLCGSRKPFQIIFAASNPYQRLERFRFSQRHALSICSYGHTVDAAWRRVNQDGNLLGRQGTWSRVEKPTVRVGRWPRRCSLRSKNSTSARLT